MGMTPVQQKLITELHERVPFNLYVMSVSDIARIANCPGARGLYRRYQGELFWSHEEDGVAAGFSTSILFHELAHSTMAVLDRPRLVDDVLYSKEEIIAELTACALMEYFDLSSNATCTRSEAYVAQYSTCDWGWLISDYEMEWCQTQSKMAFDYILRNYIPKFHEEFLKAKGIPA